MRRWLLLLGAISTEVTASLSLKGALERPALYAVVVVGYVAAFTFLALVLRAGTPLGVAYGIWGAAGVALTAVLGAAIFGEPLTGLMGIGIAVITGGVLLVELGSQAAHRDGPARSTSTPGATTGTAPRSHPAGSHPAGSDAQPSRGGRD